MARRDNPWGIMSGGDEVGVPTMHSGVWLEANRLGDLADILIANAIDSLTVLRAAQRR